MSVAIFFHNDVGEEEQCCGHFQWQHRSIILKMSFQKEALKSNKATDLWVSWLLFIQIIH